MDWRGFGGSDGGVLMSRVAVLAASVVLLAPLCAGCANVAGISDFENVEPRDGSAVSAGDTGGDASKADGAVGPAAQLSWAPSVLKFGTVALGVAAPSQLVTITNVGALAAQPIGYSIGSTGGSGAGGDFHASSPVGGAAPAFNGCDGVSLQPKQQCSIQITFKPTVKGYREGELMLSGAFPGGGIAVMLTGCGAPSC